MTKTQGKEHFTHEIGKVHTPLDVTFALDAFRFVARKELRFKNYYHILVEIESKCTYE